MRLIDADVAQRIADKELFVDEAGTVQFVLSHTPTVDAVPVVRCKDCIHYYTFACRMINPKETDFCSYGERREENV